MKISEKDLREMVRDVLSNSIKEYDALYSKKKDWKEESKELRVLLIDLLKNIENDDYREGIEKIDTVVNKLNIWKNKIEKFLS